MPFPRTPRLHRVAPSGPPASISLVVTTYNWTEALARVLDSAARQTRPPDEVIVADDGSCALTSDLVATVAGGYPVPLRHAWQDDLGFRAGRARNLAIAAAQGEYVLLLDGDMVLERHFVADHAHAARRGSFVQGSRVLTSPAFRERMLARPDAQPTPLSRGVARRRNALRSLALSDAWLSMNRRTTPHAIKTCNQGWWRTDLLQLNGFDERMEGWGREDLELAWRAHHAGINCRQLRFAGLAYHLHHEERHSDGESPNDRFVAETRAHGLLRCERGLDHHLDAARRAPLPDLRVARRQPRPRPRPCAAGR
ncbi:glycosyltransferase family 2 protein [Luteimonas terricola]|uniref:Glycosyl transferase family 2 n=1 Tax=Luteimonas terricola TaxID=645597 RepID=A0ABQ2E9Y1_9GAMM|nr:glycosyltransferase family 2 protein [Luteimonas terricola]GGJ97391.1 glycosyl transferase family 2 [Luteimonas terricola]